MILVHQLLLSALLGAVDPAAPPQFPPVLDDLARRACQYFWDESHPDTGFTLDRAPNAAGARRVPIASVSATGFALAACAVSAERGLVKAPAALLRVKRTLAALQARPIRVHGWFYHWFDWETGARVWSCEVSSIDTSIFLGGLLIAERYFHDREVSERTVSIIEAIDWRWMLTDGGARPDSLSFCHGWKPESGFLPHRWDSYCEQMVLYLQAYGAWDSMPEASWATWKRPEVEHAGLRFLVGGPLFLHQMSHVFLDFKDRRDRLGYDYFVSSKNATLANRRYCEENPKGYSGYSRTIWGLSACDGPDGYNAFGAPGWISDDGTLAPSATLASVMFTPRESLEASAQVLEKYPPVLGRYGFASGFNPSRHWQSPDAIGIDLGQLLLAIENYRDSFPHRMSMGHPINRRGMARAGFNEAREEITAERALKAEPVAAASDGR
jgi:hypothetical protein